MDWGGNKYENKNLFKVTLKVYQNKRRPCEASPTLTFPLTLHCSKIVTVLVVRFENFNFVLLGGYEEGLKRV